jgi:DNA-directed RNA polymerase subunit RPC12/RpoP
MDACPGCGFNKKAGISTSHFLVYKCSKCGHWYCYECESSNGGRQCPECKSTGHSSSEKVYLR